MDIGTERKYLFDYDVSVIKKELSKVTVEDWQFDKIFVQECTPEQVQLNELSKYDCFMKVRNFREVPFGSIEAK